MESTLLAEALKGLDPLAMAVVMATALYMARNYAHKNVLEEDRRRYTSEFKSIWKEIDGIRDKYVEEKQLIVELKIIETKIDGLQRRIDEKIDNNFGRLEMTMKTIMRAVSTNKYKPEE